MTTLAACLIVEWQSASEDRFLRVHRAILFVLGVAICVTRRIDRICSWNRQKIAELQLNLTVFGRSTLDMRLMVQPKERKIVFLEI